MNEKGIRETIINLDASAKHLDDMKRRAEMKMAEAEAEDRAVTNLRGFVLAYREQLLEQLAELTKDQPK